MLEECMSVYKKITQNKIFLNLLLLAGFIYTIFFAFIEDPRLPEGMASVIGLEHPVLFFFWNLITGLAFFYNSKAMYRTYGYKSKMGNIFIWSAIVCLAIINFIPTTSQPGAQKVLHFAGVVGYISANACTLIWFFFMQRKRFRGFSFMCALTVLMSISILICFLVIGKSGLLEIIPMWMCYVFLFCLNCTKMFKRKKPGGRSQFSVSSPCSLIPNPVDTGTKTEY